MARYTARRLLVPDLAFLMSIVTVVYCVFFFEAPQTFFRDSNTGWHLVTGEKILVEQRVPRTDPYSFSRAGEPWGAWEWASDCLMAMADLRAGLRGVVWLFAVALGIVTWLWFRLNWEVGGNYFFTWLLLAPMLAATKIEWLATPRIFGWILVLAVLLYFEKPHVQFRIRDAFLFVGLGALWANADLSFWLLPAIALVYGLSHFVRPLIWQTETAIDLREGRWFVMAAVFSGVATLLNPYGWKLHWHLFQSQGGDGGAVNTPLLVLGISAVGGVLALCEKKLAHFILAVVFAAAALRSARLMPMLALVILPLANGAITHALHRTKDLRAGLRRRLNAFLGYSDRARLLDARFSGAALTPVVLLLLWFVVPSNAGFPGEEFPVYGANEVAQLPRNIRLLAPVEYGGYLIYRFRGGLKVFVDGRRDFYGGGFLKEYQRLMEVRPGWQRELDRYRFTHALLPDDCALVRALEEAGWRVLFRDDVSTLLAAR